MATHVKQWDTALGTTQCSLRDANFRCRYLLRGGRVGVESVEHSPVQAKYTEVSREKTGSHITVSALLSCHISLHPHLPHLSPPTLSTFLLSVVLKLSQLGSQFNIITATRQSQEEFHQAHRLLRNQSGVKERDFNQTTQTDILA